MKLIKIRKGNKTYKYKPQKKYVGDLLKPYLDLKKSAEYLFNNYPSTSVDDLISYSDTENVTNMTYMFSGCTNLQTIPQLDTSKVTDMEWMFNSCTNLQTISQLDTSNVTNMQAMFYNCTKLQTIPQLNTGNVTNMKNLFNKCTNLQTIPQLNTSNVADMNSMFYDCDNLQTIPQLNTGNVTNMSYMFVGCENLQSLPQLNTSNVTNMKWMFSKCTNLQTIPQLDTSKVTEISYMFDNCENLQTIDITSLDGISSTDNINCLCRFCYSLTKLIVRNMTVIPPLNTNSFMYCYHFTGTAYPTYNPGGLKDGRIYVPDNMVETLKNATNWSTYADIIVPLSTLSE